MINKPFWLCLALTSFGSCVGILIIGKEWFEYVWGVFMLIGCAGCVYCGELWK